MLGCLGTNKIITLLLTEDLYVESHQIRRTPFEQLHIWLVSAFDTIGADKTNGSLVVQFSGHRINAARMLPRFHHNAGLHRPTVDALPPHLLKLNSYRKDDLDGGVSAEPPPIPISSGMASWHRA
jgi:hypothetical protein